MCHSIYLRDARRLKNIIITCACYLKMMKKKLYLWFMFDIKISAIIISPRTLYCTLILRAYACHYFCNTFDGAAAFMTNTMRRHYYSSAAKDALFDYCFWHDSAGRSRQMLRLSAWWREKERDYRRALWFRADNASPPRRRDFLPCKCGMLKARWWRDIYDRRGRCRFCRRQRYASMGRFHAVSTMRYAGAEG